MGAVRIGGPASVSVIQCRAHDVVNVSTVGERKHIIDNAQPPKKEGFPAGGVLNLSVSPVVCHFGTGLATANIEPRFASHRSPATVTQYAHRVGAVRYPVTKPLRDDPVLP